VLSDQRHLGCPGALLCAAWQGQRWKGAQVALQGGHHEAACAVTGGQLVFGVHDRLHASLCVVRTWQTHYWSAPASLW
jgi:hypothetical protein